MEILDPKIREKMIEYEESFVVEKPPRDPQAWLSGRRARETLSRVIGKSVNVFWETPLYTPFGFGASLGQRWRITKRGLGTAYDWASGFLGE